MSMTKDLLRVAVLSAAALSLIGCETIREAAGVTKEPPDEFAIVTKSPLVVPPDFNLKPPKPGAVPTNQSSPTQSALAALYGDDMVAAAAAIPGSFSPEERIVLANTGGAKSDPSIRKQIAADEKQMEATDDSFTDQLLFQSADPYKGTPVNADAEAARIEAAKAQGQPVAGTSGAQPSKPPAKPADSATIQKESSGGGWFDGIF
ncbi:MAG TPA: DUF3035 domain-containing protein [Rhizomicrobium sp.]|jgi:hypothetical protein